MCDWNVNPHSPSGTVIEDEEGTWIATARSNDVAASIVDMHNNGEVPPNTKVRWSSEPYWKKQIA